MDDIPAGRAENGQRERAPRSRDEAPKPTHRLRWRLTASYAIVTIVAAGTMSAADAASQLASGVSSIDNTSVATIVAKAAGAASHELPGASPDAAQQSVLKPLEEDLSANARGNLLAVGLLDEHGAVLGTRGSPAAVATTVGDPALQRTLTLLADTHRRDAAATSTDATGHGFVLATSSPKSATGVVLAVYAGPVPIKHRRNRVRKFLSLWASSWSPTWTRMIALAVALGTVTGLALSGGLLRRLRTITTTTRTWSNGQLEPTIRVHGRDELANLEHDLNTMADRLRNLLATRDGIATLTERHRVQRDLHDGVKQQLFAVELHLTAARQAIRLGDARAAAHLDDAFESTQQGQRELASALAALAPPALDGRTIHAAIAELCQRYQTLTGAKVTTDVHVRSIVPGTIANAAVRIVQEALTNVRRHAHATVVDVVVADDDGMLRVVVCDNGSGLPDAAHRPPGEGIANMRARAEALDGHVDVRPTPPGTTVTAVLPLT